MFFIKYLENHKFIIVEGLYLFLKEWDIVNCFDLKIFIECNDEIAIQRVAKRHLEVYILKIIGRNRTHF